MAEATGTDWPDLSRAVRAAEDDPRAAEEQVVALAADLPVRSVPEFFEHACRAFRSAGRTAVASAFLGRAREVEETHGVLFGIAPDTARAHRTLLELVPTGVLTPSLLHDHLARLAARPDRAAAHTEAREIVAAFFDHGILPYPGVMADLVRVAVAAGAGRNAEEDFVAERLLRGGLLRRAALPVWEAAGPALRRLCQDSAELVDLLIDAEPAGDVYDDPALDDRLRRAWLDRLVAAGAGSRLSRDRLAGLGPAPAGVLAGLARQSGEGLFPPATGVRPDAGSDPVVSAPAADPLAFRRQKVEWGKEGGPPWYRLDDLTGLVEALRDDPAGFDRDLDAFVRALGHYGNIDYPAALRRFWARPELRAVLAERVREWTAEAGTGDVLGVEIAVPRLVPLAEADFAEIAPEEFAALRLTDPVEALFQALRTGIPEELAWLTVKAGDGGGPVTVVQHDDLLTLTAGDGTLEVRSPEGVVHRGGIGPAHGFLPWFDGEACLLSRLHDGVRQTFRAAGDGEMTVDPAALSRWPRSPAAAEVTFPGATAPSLVRLHRGMIHLSAPGGAVTARIRFAPAGQPAGERSVLPPPGWWPRLRPLDPTGSAALRGIERETVEALVDAALRGREEGAAELDRRLPWITEPRLKDGVADLVRRAAGCLPDVLRLHDRLGTDRPASLPALVRSESGLRAGRRIAEVMAIRTLAGVMVEAAANGERLGSAYPVGKVPLPEGPGGLWFTLGELGGKALAAAWPWTPHYERPRLLDSLHAWGDTAWGDGSGRWRKLSFTSHGGNQQPAGELWRTPNGSMVVLYFQGRPHREATAIEYSPDGRFEPFDFPGWAPYRPVTPQGWGGAEPIAAFDRLLAQRGPAPYDVAGVRALADRTGLLLGEVASACFGFPFFVGRENERPLYPDEILALFTDPETGEPFRKGKRSYRLDRELREVLMPADPADLWTGGPDFDGAAEWWETVGSRYEDG
ncbi:hypothetical protein GCM10010191_78380 [Actinomadura vinacea]|uniref:Uncharacterized protein n=1 Tax=Actinomadura vinacea TaxID=115336 RepID=A0ABN3K4D8_9ACTN